MILSKVKFIASLLSRTVLEHVLHIKSNTTFPKANISKEQNFPRVSSDSLMRSEALTDVNKQRSNK